MTTGNKTIGVKRLGLLLLAPAASWLPATFGQGIVAQVSEMFHLGAAPNPYFLPAHAGTLYLAAPLVVVSSFVIYLTPGSLIVLAAGKAKSFAEWMVMAFGVSLRLTIALGTTAKLVLRTPLTWQILHILWLTTTILALLVLLVRINRGVQLSFPLDIRRVAWFLGMPAIGTVVLVPKIFWENFNLDGIESFEFGRSLTEHVLPYWDIQDGVFGFYQNFMLFAYPNHWFISLFGGYEASVRIPFLLYLSVLFCALLLLVEYKQKRPLKTLEEAALWFGLALYALVQAYSTTYEPFFADMAEPAATDTLWVTCFLIAAYFFWQGRLRWFFLFGYMTYMASVGGLFLLGALLLVTFFSTLPQQRRQLTALLGLLGVCLVVGVAHEALYNPIVLSGTKDQFSSINMLKRLYPPTLTEFARFNALLFPSGILPTLAFLLIRRDEPFSWMIAGITTLYFGIVYIQAWTSLHQFTPVMVLPLIVFWRQYIRAPQRTQRILLPAIAATTAVSFYLSQPRHYQINQATREFGQASLYLMGDYQSDYEVAVVNGESLYALLPGEYRLQYPEQPWGTDSLIWIYYADAREKRPETQINYIILPTTDSPPPDSIAVDVVGDAAVYVLDVETWQSDRDRDLPKVVMSSLYEPILRRTFGFFREYIAQQSQ